MKKDDVCGCGGSGKPTSRALVILTSTEAEKAEALIETTRPTPCEGERTDGSKPLHALDLPGWAEIEPEDG